MINRAVVRGGKSYPPATLAAFELLPGVAEAVRSLAQADFKVIVATNQPDVGAGKQRREVVEAMHDRIRRLLAVDAIKVCYCPEGDGCDCHKPKPGMLLEAAREHDLDLDRSYMVGDRWRDVGAGRAAGCTTIWIDRGYDEPRPVDPHHIVGSLTEAVDIILDDQLGDARGR